jgi:hypothetical protein
MTAIHDDLTKPEPLRPKLAPVSALPRKGSFALFNPGRDCYITVAVR